MRVRQSRDSAGFTLIELLVVIAIIAVLMALLVPAVQKVREASNRMICAHNMKQIGIALHNYAGDYGTFPVGGITEGNCCGNRSRTNWAIEILPYIEKTDLFRTYTTRIGNIPSGLSGGPGIYNESPVNAFTRTQRVRLYECPSDIFDETNMIAIPASGPANDLNPRIPYHRSSYRGVSGRGGRNAGTPGRVFWDACEPGLGTLNPRWKGVLHSTGAPACVQGGAESFATIKDGSSNTLMVGEYCTSDTPRRRSFWAYTYTSYNQSTVSPFSGSLNNSFADCTRKMQMIGLTDNICKRAFGSFHAGGVNFLLCDGHVKYVSEGVDMNLLADMATIFGMEATNIVEN